LYLQSINTCNGDVVVDLRFFFAGTLAG
jgi:hypothetical protein